MGWSPLFVATLYVASLRPSSAFLCPGTIATASRAEFHSTGHYFSSQSSRCADGNNAPTENKGDNKAMKFLKKIGKVGGAANRDFRHAIGVDEGPSGKSAGSTRKVSRAASWELQKYLARLKSDRSLPYYS